MSLHIAIFGAGQLAQMTAQAGIELGFRFTFIGDAGEDSSCVDALGTVVFLHEGISAEQVFELAGKPDVITVEKEMVDDQLLKDLQAFTTVAPNYQGVFIAQNRIREKNFLRDHGIATAEFEVIETDLQLRTLPERMGYPIYIKAAESGYDGYNQWRITQASDLDQVSLSDEVALIAEKHVPYMREVSIIAARNSKGDIAYYPLMENRHEDGVLISTIAPAPHSDALAKTAQGFIKTVLEAIDYVGVLTMECFDTEDGLIVNELAPRVHNSGHWSIEGAAASQFENHCRAIAGMALGDTAAQGIAGIVNMLGHHGNPDDFAAPGLFFRAYGKSERPRRKLGHIGILADNYDDAIGKLDTALVSLYGDRYAKHKP